MPSISFLQEENVSKEKRPIFLHLFLLHNPAIFILKFNKKQIASNNLAKNDFPASRALNAACPSIHSYNKEIETSFLDVASKRQLPERKLTGLRPDK